MSELKPCPFCNDPSPMHYSGGVHCDNCGALARLPDSGDIELGNSYWNNRPIEDALRTRLALAEKVISSFIEVTCVCGGDWDEFYHRDECAKHYELIKQYREGGG